MKYLCLCYYDTKKEAQLSQEELDVVLMFTVIPQMISVEIEKIRNRIAFDERSDFLSRIRIMK
jgi:hypothetical protein